MGGFERTLRVGVSEWIDFDVQRSKDGVLVVVHDLTLGRTSNVAEMFPDRATNSVGDFTVAELKQLDIGSWFRPGDFAGQIIPTFSEALDFLSGRVGITFELKHPRLYPGVEEQVANTIRRQGLASSDDIKLGSFEHDSLERFHAALPTIKICGAFRHASELRTSKVRDILTSVSFAPQYTQEQLDLARQYRCPVGVTMNSARGMQQAIDDGLQHMSSDYPDVLSRIVRGLAPFDEEPTVVIDEVIVDFDGGSRVAVLRNSGAEPVKVSGWFLWNGVASPIDSSGSTMRPDETTRVTLAPARARDVSSIQALALHSADDEVRDLAEYWAVPKPADT